MEHESRAGILEQSMEAKNRVGIGLSYRPASLHRLAESIHWIRFLGSLKVKKYQPRSKAWQTEITKISSYFIVFRPGQDVSADFDRNVIDAREKIAKLPKTNCITKLKLAMPMI